MASITTRETGTTGTNGVTRKNAPLTNSEIDTNFVNLNDNKLETSFTGSSNIVTLGTVATGTWNATTIGTTKGGTGLTSFTNGGAVYATSTSALTTGTLPIASGGTGATNAAAARTALGVAIGVGGSQAYDADLDGLSALTGTGIVFRSADNTYIAGNSLGSVNLALNSLGVGVAASATAGRIDSTSLVVSAGAQASSLGIGVAASGTAGRIDSTSLVVSAGAQSSSLGVGTAASGTAGEIRATNNITAYFSSDIKFKENIQEIPNALQTVNTIGGKLFDWTDSYLESHGGEDSYFLPKQDFGVIAQDVQLVFPRAVRVREDGSLAVDYEKLCALAFQAIKELTDKVELLQSKVGK
jgi:hypothetical protein